MTVAVIDRALATGIRYLDAAPLYRHGVPFYVEVPSAGPVWDLMDLALFDTDNPTAFWPDLRRAGLLDYEVPTP